MRTRIKNNWRSLKGVKLKKEKVFSLEEKKKNNAIAEIDDLSTKIRALKVQIDQFERKKSIAVSQLSAFEDKLAVLKSRFNL